jgi:hypothetical protein
MDETLQIKQSPNCMDIIRSRFSHEDLVISIIIIIIIQFCDVAQVVDHP